VKIIYSELFNQFPEIVFGFSTKAGLNRTAPFYFNLSLTVGDDEKIVRENREAFYNNLGLTTESIAIQKQIHSEVVTVVYKSGLVGQSDAMITKETGLGLAISSADCVPIFIYDKENKIVAGVHSGWRGTQKQILKKTLSKLKTEFYSKPENIFAYIGPAISQKKYEVGKEVADQFDQKYSRYIDSKLCLDVTGVNLDVLSEFGIPKNQIEVSPLCSYSEKDLLHSFRRDGNNSGRALGVIALKGSKP
jgi:polyphenol oxidase